MPLLLVFLTIFAMLPSAARAQELPPAPKLSPEVQALLAELQEAGVRYFYDYGHPISGLAREGTNRNDDECTIGATGFGLFNMIVGVQRGFLDRTAAAVHIHKILRFLYIQADRFHGAFPHWLNGRTGKTIPFTPDDDGADLVETAFLCQGLLAIRQYFAGADPLETDIRTLADTLWREVEWNWFVKDEGESQYLVWHWSPTVGWSKNMGIRGFNEGQIAYLLALGSPTYSISPETYWKGWRARSYLKQREEFGVLATLGYGLSMPLFFIHYSYLGFDPRALTLNGKSYFEHFQDLCRIQMAYAKSRTGTFLGYGPLWGLTASYGPDGYRAYSPGPDDDGTIAPTAALSSIPYLPEESIAFLQELQKYRDKLWGTYGFIDSFNLTRNWVAQGYLGIDVGPIAPMIENYLTGACWKTFMKAPEIQIALQRIAETTPIPAP